MIPVAIFVFGGAISSFAAQSPSGSAVQTVHAAYVLLLWPAVGAIVLRTRRQVTTAVALWSVSAAIASVGAIAQLLGAHLPGVAQQGSRMTGFTEHLSPATHHLSLESYSRNIVPLRHVGDDHAVSDG